MSTAIAASGSADKTGSEKGGSLPQGGGNQKAGFFTPYRPGEGYATRLGMMAVVMAYVFFAAHHWYYSWVMIRDLINGTFMSFLTGWMYEPSVVNAIAMVGVVLIVGGGFALAYRFIYATPRTAEFLIKTDGELGKVTWPKISPWFKADTQVWGATYVVLIVVAFLTLYVFVVDMVLQFLANTFFYGS